MRARATAAGLLSFVIVFGGITSLGVVPLFMHDDYEYTYPSFSLVHAGDFGSPLMGSGLNIAHRTYNFTMYYYATVHAALIRLYGERSESIALANIFHFALLIASAMAYAVYRGDLVIGLVFVAAFVSDRLVIAAALAGRPEMTAAFGYFAATVMLLEWHVWRNRRPVVLAAASAGAIVCALTHPAAAIVLLPIFVLFVAIHFRDLLDVRHAAAFLAPCAIPALLYGYFAATDDWRNIVVQMLGNAATGNVAWPQRYEMAAAGRVGELLSSAQPVWEHFANVHFAYALPGVMVGLVAAAMRDRLPSWPTLRVYLHGVIVLSVAFALSFIMDWLFLKNFVGSYTVIYRSAWYLALALSVSMLLFPLRVWFEVQHSTPLTAGAVALAVAMFIAAHDTTVAAERLHNGFKFAEYGRFRAELNGAMLSAGAKPADRVYCPSPFGTYLSPPYHVVTYGGERYFAGMWPASFDAALAAKRAVAPNPSSLAYLKKIVFLNPRWIVTWDGDYSDLYDYMRFVKSFPTTDPEIRIVEATSYVSPHTYLGRIHVFRVELADEFSRSLDRSMDPERRLAHYR